MTAGGEELTPVHIPAWKGFPLRRRMEEATGLPVFVDNDAKAVALAEGWVGAAAGVSAYVGMVVSTGVGGGIVLDGRLLDGLAGNAGHIGHVVVEPGGRPCFCGGRGCLEGEASGRAIEAITGRPPAEARPEVVERTGTLVGRAVASVANLLDLRLAVVAGSVALGFGRPFFAAAQAEIDALARLDFSRGTRIRPAGLGGDAPLVGAAAVALYRSGSSRVAGEDCAAHRDLRRRQLSPSAAPDPTRWLEVCLRFPPGFASQEGGGDGAGARCGARSRRVRPVVTDSGHPRHAARLRPRGRGRRHRIARHRSPPGGGPCPGPRLAIGVVVAAGIVARFVAASHLWLDEALTVNIAAAPAVAAARGAPPRRLPAAVLRRPPRLDGVLRRRARSPCGPCRASAPWPACRWPGGWASGSAAGPSPPPFLVLLALSPFAVQYATEARMYSMAMLLVLAGGLALANLLERPSLGLCAAVALLTGALLLTHYYALYTVAAVGAVLAWHAWRGEERAAARRALLSMVAGSLLFLPWVPVLLYQAAHTGRPLGEHRARRPHRHRHARGAGLRLPRRRARPAAPGRWGSSPWPSSAGPSAGAGSRSTSSAGNRAGRWPS